MKLFYWLMLLIVPQTFRGQNINYFDQKPPGQVPVVFAPNVVSVEGRFELGCSYSPDGRQFAFGVAGESIEDTYILISEYNHGKWSAPARGFVPDNTNTFFPFYFPGKPKFYFSKSINDGELDIWASNLSKKGIRHVRPLPQAVNSKEREGGFGITLEGTIYFTSNRDTSRRCCGDIYRSQLTHGKYLKSVKVTDLSTPADEEGLFISPKEDFIIIQSWQPHYESMHDLFISYRKDDNTWTKLHRLDSTINTKQQEQRPCISPDRRYLFFSRFSIGRKEGKDVNESEIYWVSTKNVFKPYQNKAIRDTVIKVRKKFRYSLPSNLFKTIDDIQLYYTIQLSGGKELPEWLSFNNEDFSFSGVPTQMETLSIEILASDDNKNTAMARFNLTVMGEQQSEY